MFCSSGGLGGGDVAVCGDSICSWTVRAGLDLVAGGEFTVSGKSGCSWNVRVRVFVALVVPWEVGMSQFLGVAFVPGLWGAGL